MMKLFCFLMMTAIAGSVFAGDLWEVVSTSIGPDGSPQPYTQKICSPKGDVNPSQMLGGLGNCSFDQKNGNALAMTFAMTCKAQGIPAELESMKVAGDARLNGDKFDMRYTITVGGNQTLPGNDFKMNGNLEAHKVGQCKER